MTFRIALRLAILSLAVMGASAPDKLTPVKVTEGIFMLEHSRGSGNSTVIFTDEGVIVFDFHIETADQIVSFIRKATDKKIKYLISSHSAGDHASGAWHFREDAPIWIATKNQVQDLRMQMREEFLERKNSNDPRYAAYKKGEPMQPNIGIDGPMTLYFGGLTFQITPEGRAHSTGDLTVYIPQKRIMLMGDLLDTEIHPGQGESAGVFYSNVAGWIKVLDSIMARSLAAETYVPGHGPVHMGRGIKDLEEQKRYFVVMRDEVAKMVQAGKSLEQIETEFKVPQEFAHYKRPERLKQFLKLFFHQLAETGF